MKYIQIGINLSDELGIKSVVIDFNSTGLESDSKLIKLVAVALLKSFDLNKEDVLVQDLLNELDIDRQV